MIGEKSNPPMGGTSLLNKFKYKSVASFIPSNGCLYQFMLGIKLKKHLAKISRKYI